MQGNQKIVMFMTSGKLKDIQVSIWLFQVSGIPVATLLFLKPQKYGAWNSTANLSTVWHRFFSFLVVSNIVLCLYLFALRKSLTAWLNNCANEDSTLLCHPFPLPSHITKASQRAFGEWLLCYPVTPHKHGLPVLLLLQYIYDTQSTEGLALVDFVFLNITSSSNIFKDDCITSNDIYFMLIKRVKTMWKSPIKWSLL